MDKSTADDIRVELEENRQYLVRALRAVELTTAECKEEMRLANLKADNAVALVQSLEATVFEKEGEIVFVSAGQMPHGRIAPCLNHARGGFVILTQDTLHGATQHNL